MLIGIGPQIMATHRHRFVGNPAVFVGIDIPGEVLVLLLDPHFSPGYI